MSRRSRAQRRRAKGYVLVRDGELPGFGLRVTANDSRAFVLTYTFEGQQRRLTIGAWPAWTATAARERAKELRRQIDNGQDPLGQRQARREALTVDALANEYQERHLAKLKSGDAIELRKLQTVAESDARREWWGSRCPRWLGGNRA